VAGTSGHDTTALALARYNPDGSVDTTFGAGGSVVFTGSTFGSSVHFHSMTTQADGKILVTCGLPRYDTTIHASVDDGLLLRLNADGTPDMTFNGTGWLITPAPAYGFSDVAVQSDSKLVMFGGGPQGSGWFLTRRLSDGTLDAATPQVGSFTASPNLVTAGGGVTLTAANVVDPNPGGTITQVAFYADSNGDGVLEPGTWTYSFSTAGWAAGTDTLFAHAEDAYGLFSDPLALSLQVL
jgi:uncharacterized delta-60 repeat protein